MTGLTFTPAARTDLRLITAYSRENFGERQARHYLFAIDAACKDLAAGRIEGRKVDEIVPGFWQRVCGSHVIFYRYRNDDMEVMRILHRRMQFENHL